MRLGATGLEEYRRSARSNGPDGPGHEADGKWGGRPRITLRAPPDLRDAARCEEATEIEGHGEVIVRTAGLGFAYRPDRFAVRGLTFELVRGEVFGLLGRNGAGKTTTVRLLTTLLPPTEGTATLFGKDLRQCGRAERARIGVVLQAESLDFVTVEQNLRLYAYLWGVGRETAKSRAEEMLTLFELGHVRGQKPWALSGGERRRFQVARELMHDMELLFLDEPTVGLDALTRSRILDYLADRARHGLSIVFTTHILHEADRLCHRIGVMHEGRLLTIGSPSEIKRAYSHSRTVEAEFDRALTASEDAELQALLAREAEGLSIVESRSDLIVFRARNAEALVASVVRWADGSRLGLDRVAVSEASLEEAFVSLVSGSPGSNVPLTREAP